MADELAREKVRPNTGPVFVANHYRAIADLAIAEVQAGFFPRTVTVRCVNQWLDTREQIDTLKNEYLRHLPKQLSGTELAIYEDWLSTIRYEE
ncbi:hypothetical protein [Ruegeria jejuensis]|uniref:hypothetical protein n=1 Tax=Ruegeria jejuensis TaxID=3233338 RepID=UPI00355C9BB1